MLDLLFTATATQLGKVVLDQVLELSQGALEDYTKDFFKESLGSGVAKLKASALKDPMGEAIAAFIKAFIQELKDNDIPDSSIKHHYTKALRGFVKDKSVKPILGKAFETGCDAIDHKELQSIWGDRHQQSGWQFPEEDFRWRRVGKAYVQAVKEIVKADGELRSLLNTDLLETIAQNTAPLSPGFDVNTYRESLQSSYGYLKLYTLDSTDRVDAIKLWNMFIEQTVREALPPTRYDLPLDIKRQLKNDGQLEDAPSPEELEHYRRDYFQQPARKALEAVMDAQRSVILGDPGAGKSTLLQYLALEWVEGKSEPLPLLIELREYALATSSSFLEFLHSGSGADWQFDQQQLHQHLLDQPTVMMFDGLDEVFDRPTQSAITDDIIRFAQQYPQARVIVTSRIIGYNPERFQYADFRQFTIQPLDESEMHEFIDRWYDLAMGADTDKVRLKTRLKEAISQSKAIQNLADNPLLLTMMAILNRRQELPRDRADLYDQASRVLLYHWDVDHKRLQLPLDAIGRREKQEMLRLIAYEMQAGEAGLKGNLISAERLTKILTDYLINQGFSEPREKAHRLIQQLRERNFILCYRGADTYGFMHRTFLEYFCAVEIVHRFEKQRTLTFEQLRDNIFGNHWQDETWNEVLRLICGMIDQRFKELLIDFLICIKVNKGSFLDDPQRYRPPGQYLAPEALRNITLAMDILGEGNKNLSNGLSEKILKQVKDEIDNQGQFFFGSKLSSILAEGLGKNWGGDEDLFLWIKKGVNRENSHEYWCCWFTRRIISVVAKYWKEQPDTKKWLRDLVLEGHNDWGVSECALMSLASSWKDETSIKAWLKEIAISHELWAIRRGAIESLTSHWRDDNDILPIVLEITSSDPNWATRHAAIGILIERYRKLPEIYDIFIGVIKNDPGGESGYFEGDPICEAVNALISHFPKNPENRQVINDRILTDSDPKRKAWLQEILTELDSQITRSK